MITIPVRIWKSIFEEFSKNHRNVEQVCYLDGLRFGNDSVVTTLVFPVARLESGYFEVTADAMSQAGKHLRQFGLKRIAQVHTHPTDWIGHSPWDDSHAYSQVPGAISIVLPHYGLREPKLTSIGIHVRTETGWLQIPSSEIETRLKLVPSDLSFKATIGEEHVHKRIEPASRRSWWSFITFWRN